MSDHIMSLRMDEQLARSIKTVAMVDDVPTSQAIREAIKMYTAARWEDFEFRMKHEQLMEKLSAGIEVT